MSVAIRQKDPAGVNNFTLNWADYLTELGGLTISSSTWTVPAGITQITAGNTATTATIRLSGGTHGSDYEIVNHVVLSDGQEDERSLTIQVRQAEAGTSVDATERSNALATLNEWAQMDVVPLLLEPEIEAILDRCKRASIWTSATAYNPNDIILPTVRTGHRYRCIVSGTSGATEPFTGDDRWPTSAGATVTETGSLLTWKEDGPEYPSLYDVRQAAYECWDLKTRKASQFMQTGDLHFEMVYSQCVKQRDNFTPMGFA